MDVLSEIWSGLSGIGSLFSLFPSDILSSFGVIFVGLVAVGVKRIFFS